MTIATKLAPEAPVHCKWCGGTYQLIEDDGPIVCRPCVWSSAAIGSAWERMEQPKPEVNRMYDPHDR